MHVPPTTAELREIPRGEVYFYARQSDRSWLWSWSYYVFLRRGGDWYRDELLTNGLASSRRGAERRAARAAARMTNLLRQPLPAATRAGVVMNGER